LGRGAKRSNAPTVTYDVLIVGAGVLGAALSLEARRLGLTVLCVGPDQPSPSFSAGDHFRLNTWSRPDQHGPFHRAIVARDRRRFAVASALSEAAYEALKSSDVARVAAKVTDVRSTHEAVQVRAGRKTYAGRAVLLCLGWGRLKVDLPSATAQRLVRRRALDFHAALNTKRLRGTVAVVGAGPSALSFLEVCVERSIDQLLWFRSGSPPDPKTKIGRMYEARYGALIRRVVKDPLITIIPARVSDVRWTKGRWILDGRAADELVWCGGFEAPLDLISKRGSLEPLVLDGARVALRRRGEPVFQLGPALDQLGLADWDVGPFAEWFNKGQRLLQNLSPLQRGEVDAKRRVRGCLSSTKAALSTK